MPTGPLRNCDGSRTIDEQARLGADLPQVGIVIRNELRPAPEIDLAAQQVALAAVALHVDQHEVVRQIARVARPRDEVIDRGRRRQAALAVEAPPVLQLAQGLAHLG